MKSFLLEIYPSGLPHSFITVCCQNLSCPPNFRAKSRRNMNQSTILQVSSVFLPTEESRNPLNLKMTNGPPTRRGQKLDCLLSQENTVGIIGGLSAFSTLVFLEKLVWWSSRNGNECIPFVVCSDPTIQKSVLIHDLRLDSNKYAHVELKNEVIIELLRHKRVYLEKSGARCILMPCYISDIWHREVSKGCSVPFLNAGDCIANELKEASLKPVEAGSNVRIGVLTSEETFVAGFYQEKLQSKGFEGILPDKPTIEHIVTPAAEALKRKDMEGARNLLRIAIHTLLVRGVNLVILASDEFQDLLPPDDPLVKKCIDPMDALARATVKWAQSNLSKDSQCS